VVGGLIGNFSCADEWGLLVYLDRRVKWRFERGAAMETMGKIAKTEKLGRPLSSLESFLVSLGIRASLRFRLRSNLDGKWNIKLLAEI
jgi:hypothetical protein